MEQPDINHYLEVEVHLKVEPEEVEPDPDEGLDCGFGNDNGPPSTEFDVKKTIPPEFITVEVPASLNLPSSSKDTHNLIENKNTNVNFKSEENTYNATSASNVTNNDLLNETELNSSNKQLPTYPCNLCNYKAIRIGVLETHLKLHSAKAKFICKTCSYIAVHKRSFNDHLRKHTGEKPYVCSFCGKGFSCRDGLQHHVGMHYDKEFYACETCDEKFDTHRKLNIHRKYHDIFRLVKKK